MVSKCRPHASYLSFAVHKLGRLVREVNNELSLYFNRLLERNASPRRGPDYMYSFFCVGSVVVRLKPLKWVLAFFCSAG